MSIKSSPYISRIKIVNFRNFQDIDVELDQKQIIIGENNVGKTNLLKAIQLILDPKLSDNDRYLTENDFYVGLDDPMENGEEITISIDIKGYNHNKTLLASLSDASISDDPPTLRLTYHYYPTPKRDGTYEYFFNIYQGNREEKPFSHQHRRYLNLRVINAIRDVESEMKNSRKSPVNHLLKDYDIRKDELNKIATKLKETSDDVLSIDELIDLTKKINSRFSNIIGDQIDASVSLETMDYDPNRILKTLKLMIGDEKRPTSDTSLGLNNILYISLILLSLEDKTIPRILKEDSYKELLLENGSKILEQSYSKNENKKYILKDDYVESELLYSFMDQYFSIGQEFTILAIEEPESHLHPALQRIIYKDVMKKNTSVLMTTHSPYITSVAPLNSIVHLRGTTGNGTEVRTTANLELTDSEKSDLKRYIDVKRGEIYFGKGVILVEGVAEEYLIPTFAELIGYPLDNKGIICCNVNSVNFHPYVKFLESLGIPYVVITDGDYYYTKSDGKKFGALEDKHHHGIGYQGNDRIKKLLIEVDKMEDADIPDDFEEQDELFANFGFFIGKYTMEIDMMDETKNEDAQRVFINTFNNLTNGGSEQKQNFERSLKAGDYVACLNKIESNHSQIGKGRYAQGLSDECVLNNIPEYIKSAIEFIYERVYLV